MKDVKNILIIVAIAVLFFFGGWSCNNDYTSDHLDLNVAYFSYYQKCETLLDSIAAHDECFMDTEGETDEYCDYVDAKQHLDSVRVFISKKEAQ